MNILIHFVYFKIIYHVNDKIIGKLYEFWRNCLDISYINYNEEIKDVWRIYAKRVPKGREVHYWNFQRKIIVNYYSNSYDLTEHNAFLRECITKISLYLGMLWIHASAFRIKDKVIFVLGEKNAGKTTWLLNAIMNLGATFIGNDQLPLFICEDKLSTMGWRPDIKIRPDSLRILGINEKRLLHADRYYLQLNDAIEIEIEGLSARNGYSIEKIDFQNRKISTCFMKVININSIIYIGKIKERNDISLLWDKIFEDDKENLLPCYLCDWLENMNYWLERIGNVHITKSARDSELKTYNYLKKMPIFILDNRMSINEINEFLIYNM